MKLKDRSNRNLSRNQRQQNELDNEDRQQIRAIIRKKSMVIFFNILFWVSLATAETIILIHVWQGSVFVWIFYILDNWLCLMYIWCIYYKNKS